MFGLDSIEMNIMSQEKNVEQLEQDLSENEKHMSAIECSISELQNDIEVLAIIEKNQSLLVSERLQYLEKSKECILKLEECENQIQNELEKLNDEKSVLQELSDVGEDVSDANKILESRYAQLENHISLIMDLKERLGVVTSDNTNMYQDNIEIVSADFIQNELEQTKDITYLKKMRDMITSGRIQLEGTESDDEGNMIGQKIKRR